MNIDQHDLSRICGKPALFYLLAVDAWIKFNTYRFADYKEQVIDLLWKVPTVSVGSRPDPGLTREPGLR